MSVGAGLVEGVKFHFEERTKKTKQNVFSLFHISV